MRDKVHKVIKSIRSKAFDVKTFDFRLARAACGMSLVEVLLSIAIFSLIATGLLGAITYGREGSSIGGMRTRAAMVAQEGIEAVRSIDYNKFIDGTYPDATYGLSSSGAAWGLSGPSDTVDSIFVRTVTLSTIDNKTKQAVVTVKYDQNQQRKQYSVTYTTRITAWAWSWANGLIDTTFDITTAVATSDGKRVKVLGDYAYVVRSNTSNDLRVIQIANNGIPLTTPVNAGGFTLPSAANNIEVDQIGATNKYAFVTLASGNPEVVVLDVTNPAAISQIATINPTGNQSANGIDFSNDAAGTFIYFGRAGDSGAQAEFYVYNVANPAAPAALGTFSYGTLNSTAVNDVAVLTNVTAAGDWFAYVATSDTANEVQVITGSDTKVRTGTLTKTNIKNLSTSTTATTINAYIKTSTTADTDDVVVMTGIGAATNNLFALYLTAPRTLSVTSAAFNFAMTIADISKDSVHDYAIAAGGAATSGQLKVLNVSSFTDGGALPAAVKVLNYSGVSNTLNGVTYNATLDRIVAVGTVDTQELILASPR